MKIWPFISLVLFVIVIVLLLIGLTQKEGVDAIKAERDSIKTTADMWHDSATIYHGAFMLEMERAAAQERDTIKITQAHEKSRIRLRGLSADSVLRIVAAGLNDSL